MIRIKVKSRIRIWIKVNGRIRIRIKMVWIRYTGCSFGVYSAPAGWFSTMPQVVFVLLRVLQVFSIPCASFHHALCEFLPYLLRVSLCFVRVSSMPNARFFHALGGFLPRLMHTVILHPWGDVPTIGICVQLVSLLFQLATVIIGYVFVLLLQQLRFFLGQRGVCSYV
jgi:hypothetical protein